MARVFVPDTVHSGQCILLSSGDSHHLVNVLRLGVGDLLTVIDKNADEFEAKIIGITDGGTAQVSIGGRRLVNREPDVEVTLYQGLPKKDKLELVIEKGTELGAVRFVPVVMTRSIVKLSSEKAKRRQERWQRIAEAAAKQARRQIVPSISTVLGFQEMLAELQQQQDAKILVPYERASAVSIGDACRNFSQKRISIVVGPEGGFTDAEVEALTSIGAELVTLGPRILRTETAGIVSLALVLFATGNMGGSIHG